MWGTRTPESILRKQAPALPPKSAPSARGHILVQRAKGWLINYSQFWGVHPFHYDAQTARMSLTTSKLGILRWKLTIFLLSLTRVLAVWDFIHVYRASDFSLLDPETVLRCWKLLLLLFAGFMHLHTVWKQEEIPRFTNGFSRLHEWHMQKYGTEKSLSMLAGLALMFFFASLTSLTVNMIPIFIIDCQWHFLADTLETCNNVSPYLSTRTVFHVLAHFGVSTESVCSAFIYLAFAGESILVEKKMLQTLVVGPGRDIVSQKDNFAWFLEYRTHQVWFFESNSFLCETLLPVSVAFIMTTCVLVLLLLVHGNAGLFFGICCTAFSAVCFTFIGTVLGQVSALTALCRKAVVSKRNQLPDSSKYYDRLLKSCSLMFLNLGSFGKVDYSVMLASIGAIISYTVSMLVAVCSGPECR